MQTFIPNEESNIVLKRFFSTPTYEEAQQILKGNVFSTKGYEEYRKSHPHLMLPSQPRNTYKANWTNIYDFLGTYPRNDREWALLDYHAKVKSGQIQKKPKVKSQVTQENQPNTTVKSVSSVDSLNIQVDSLIKSGADLRSTFVKLIRHYDIFEECKGALRSMYTHEELLDRL